MHQSLEIQYISHKSLPKFAINSLLKKREKVDVFGILMSNFYEISTFNFMVCSLIYCILSCKYFICNKLGLKLRMAYMAIEGIIGLNVKPIFTY